MKKYVYIGIIVMVILLVLVLIPATYPKTKLKNKYILISIHDVTPFYEPQINKFLIELEKRNINNFTLLITPNWDGNFDVNEYPEFTKKLVELEDKGAELTLHGYDHKGDKFMYLDKTEAKERLDRARKLYKQAFNSRPKGFIPPMWKQSKATYELLKEQKFRYTETFGTLEYFSGNKYAGFPLGMESWSSNKYAFITKVFSNIYARLIWNRGGVVRYTIHPREVDNDNFEATLKLLDGFLERGWKPITYSELEGEI